MQNNYALPQFTDPRARREKLWKWGVIGGGVALVVPLGIFVAMQIATSRGSDDDLRAGPTAAGIVQEPTSSAPAPAAALAANNEAETVENLPPPAEPTADEVAARQASAQKANKRSKPRARSGSKRVATRSASSKSSTSASTSSSDKRMKGSDIDKLLSQFR